LHAISCSANTIIPNISKHIWKGVPMKIGACGKIIAITYTISYFPFLFAAYLPTSVLRQINRAQINVGNQHIHQNQRELLSTFKQNIQESKNKKLELYSITTAIAHGTKFKPFLKAQKTIKESIEEFHNIPGYTRVFTRIIEGAIKNNSSDFNGAMAEIQLALSILYQNKKILEFNKVITQNGKPVTEIDIETEDQNGKTWYEVKVRKRLHRHTTHIKKQQDIQKALAKSLGISKHEMIIVKNFKKISPLGSGEIR
jgi:hypothetical protein